MRNTLLSLLKKPSGRYVIIGVGVYIFELLVIFVSQSLGAGPVLAVTFGFWLGLILSFGLQKFVTFGDKRMRHQILLPQILAVSLLVLFNFGFTVLATQLFAALLPVAVIRTLALGITTIWNFYLYRTHIFISTSTVASEEL